VFDLPPRVLFGAAYYNEYQPGDQLKVDLDLMAEARFSVIRVGESVWSTWEPEDGRFELDWLTPVIDGAHQRGISVILGTPTYAVPPWLFRHYPEIAGEASTGQRIPWGARQEVDFTHAAFRFHAERVTRQIVGHYAQHPAVIGFQVDNEPGLRLFHNHGVFQRFVDSLRRTYGDVETLNSEWGLVYWSHRLSAWADLWTPDGNVQPQYDVAWRRFQAEQTTEFISWQAGIVREYSRPDQFVTTCIAYIRPALDDDRLTDDLDLTAGNPYYKMQDGLERPDHRGTPRQDWTTDGTWSVFLSADRMFSSRQEPFLVTETNATQIGFPWDNRPAYDGQWRQAAWALISRGATMIEYWHWHTLHFGAETNWGGILPHSGEPGRTYDQISALGAEIESAGDIVARLWPDADVAMLYSTPSKWLLQKFPLLAHDDGTPDIRSYEGFFDPFYRGAFEAGRQIRIVHSRQLVGGTCDGDRSDPVSAASQFPVLVVPGHYMADDHTLDWLLSYAAAGGHLVLGPQTGYADHEGRARRDRKPSRIASAAGVWFDEYSNVSEDLPVTTAPGSGLEVPAGAAGRRWFEALQPSGAEVIAGYRHPHFGSWPAVTTKQHVLGRITYVGTVPNESFARALFDWLPRPVGRPAWTELPETVTAASGVGSAGRRVHFVHNWSWAPTEVIAPCALRDALADESFQPGDPVPLAKWDARVLFEPEDTSAGSAT
jgi:beta-galactosidase